MKTLLGSLAALVAFACSANAGGIAQYPFTPHHGAPVNYAANTGGQYGLHPGLKKIFGFNGGAGSCSSGRCGTTGCSTGGCGVGAPANCGACQKLGRPCCKQHCGGPTPATFGPPGGTLVFPQHPFIRSPRDFFMEER